MRVKRIRLQDRSSFGLQSCWKRAASIPLRVNEQQSRQLAKLQPLSAAPTHTVREDWKQSDHQAAGRVDSTEKLYSIENLEKGDTRVDIRALLFVQMCGEDQLRGIITIRPLSKPYQ